jgi:CubicO group peptidase (beta-lactamase class C family)
MSWEALEAYIQEKTRSSSVLGLSVSVIKGDRVVWERGFGFADLATSNPAIPQTSHLWFSMTKIATARAVLRLAEGGNLGLDAPVTDYFADFSIVSQPVQVSVRHLLSHSSGLANPLPIRAGTPHPPSPFPACAGPPRHTCPTSHRAPPRARRGP